MTQPDLERFIAAWLDGRINPQESQALQEQLRKSPEARATFQRYARLDAAIREAADVRTLGSVDTLTEVSPAQVAEEASRAASKPTRSSVSVYKALLGPRFGRDRCLECQSVVSVPRRNG